MIHTLIFDWDGTLHNTETLYGCAFRRAYAALVEGNYAPEREYSDREVSRYLGMNAPDMWNQFMPELPENIKKQASDQIGREMVAEIQAGRAKLYPGTEETLSQLKAQGYELVILSNCKRDYMEAHRRAFALDRWFRGYYCCQDFDFAPKEEIFPVIQQNHPGAFAVIGDRVSDFRVAEAHRLAFVGCRYGFGTPEELLGADKIARQVGEIPELIWQLQSGL